MSAPVRIIIYVIKFSKPHEYSYITVLSTIVYKKITICPIFWTVRPWTAVEWVCRSQNVKQQIITIHHNKLQYTVINYNPIQYRTLCQLVKKFVEVKQQFLSTLQCSPPIPSRRGRWKEQASSRTRLRVVVCGLRGQEGLLKRDYERVDSACSCQQLGPPKSVHLFIHLFLRFSNQVCVCLYVLQGICEGTRASWEEAGVLEASPTAADWERVNRLPGVDMQSRSITHTHARMHAHTVTLIWKMNPVKWTPSVHK